MSKFSESEMIRDWELSGLVHAKFPLGAAQTEDKKLHDLYWAISSKEREVDILLVHESTGLPKLYVLERKLD